MIKKSFKIFVFLAVIIFSFLLRKKNYAQIPIPGQSVDEYSYSWVGLSLLETGVPIGISGIPGYQNHLLRYINVDRLYQTLSSDPLEINYPWMDHPPLLGLITGGYAKLAGAKVFEDTTALLIRRPIIIISTLSVALLMILVWINLGFWPSIFSGLIYGTAPLVVLSSRMIQAENAIIPCLLAVMICLSLYSRQSKDIWLILSAVISGIATLFKLTGVVCYLYSFFYLFSICHKKYRQFYQDYLFFLAVSLPISCLFVFYGLSYGVKNFFNIFFSNTDRFYGIGPSAIIDLIRNQRLTQHKFLPEIWIISGWFTFLISTFKKKSGSIFLTSTSLSIISYLIIFIFFGSQPYGWYTFPFWPLLILNFVAFSFESLKTHQNHLIIFILSTIILGANISRVIGIFEFQPIAAYWRVIVPLLVFSLTFKSIKHQNHIRWLYPIFIIFIIISIYLNYRYLQLINLDFWWQNIS